MALFAPLKQFISAGHNTNDPGAVANGYKENNLTIDLRNTILKYSNIKEIIIDKDTETNTQYQRRIKPGAGSVVLDIHFDASSNAQVKGVTAFVNQKDFKNTKSLSYQFGDELTKFISKTLGTNNRGVKSENNSQHTRLGILNLGAGCSVLIEIEFITNKEAMTNYQNCKEELAAGISKLAQKYDNIIK